MRLTFVVRLGPDQSAKIADGLRDVVQQGAERSSHVAVVQHSGTGRVRLDVGEQAVQRAECESCVFERMKPAAEPRCGGDAVDRAPIEPATGVQFVEHCLQPRHLIGQVSRLIEPAVHLLPGYRPRHGLGDLLEQPGDLGGVLIDRRAGRLRLYGGRNTTLTARPTAAPTMVALIRSVAAVSDHRPQERASR